MKTLVAITLAIGVIAPALPGSAAAATSEAKKIAGSWTMSDVSDDGSCTLKLASEAKLGGWSVNPSDGCIKVFPRLKDAKAWVSNDGGKAISLINAQRQRVYRFEKNADGDFVTTPNRDGRQFSLSRGGAAKDPKDKAADKKEAAAEAMTAQERMSGRWSVVGAKGKPRCAFTSKSNVAGTKGTLVAKPSATCSAKWKAVGWAGWVQTRGKLELTDGKGKVTHTLSRTDPVTWTGETKAGAPLSFSRD